VFPPYEGRDGTRLGLPLTLPSSLGPRAFFAKECNLLRTKKRAALSSCLSLR
jgi:hypothetical protein